MTEEVLKEKEKLESLGGKVLGLNEKVGELEGTKQGLEEFIGRESDVLKRYPIEKKKLDTVLIEVQELRQEFVEKKEWMAVRNKELDDYQEYVKDYSGRLTSNIHKVHQITALMNQKMKRENILIRLELPVNKIEIPF